MSVFIAFQEYLVPLHLPIKQTWILVLLGLRLFNLDIIREHGTEDRYYVRDINYFPGYGKMPEYEHVFTDFLLSLVSNKKKPGSGQRGVDEPVLCKCSPIQYRKQHSGKRSNAVETTVSIS